MNRKKHYGTFVVFCVMLAVCSISTANAQKVEIYDIYPEQVIAKAFRLDKSVELAISATVGSSRSANILKSNCWILDAKTRNLVWKFPKRRAEKIGSKRLLSVEDKILLPRGIYEVYYAIDPERLFANRNLFDIIFNRNQYGKGLSSDWGITVSPAESSKSDRFFHTCEPDRNNNAIISINNVFNDEYYKKGFSLATSLRVRIYAIGEGARSGRQMYDFGWITNLATYERIWEMKYRKTVHAGGARKNRKFDGTITLPAGDYMVHYVTDDSHSNEEWNKMPPYDPFFYGITIWAADSMVHPNVIKPITEISPLPPIIEITRARNNVFESEGFQLTQKVKLHIFALGEASLSRKMMADYGWIVDATTRETVWKMDYRETEYAGGGRKNRVFDKLITLAPGKYIVFYKTDDSHAFRDWNVDQPWMPESWGITISCPDKACQQFVKPYSEQSDPDILAQMVRIGNDEKVYQKFELHLPTDVRIYCIGEGSSGQMYDFGWIEATTTREKIWEMNYAETHHAGGGKKNRLVNKVIKLNPGKYEVFYKTDDSHAFRDWNTSPPEDEEHWGITIIRQPHDNF